MDDSKADILMMFKLQDNSTPSGESTLQSAPGDKFMDGFQAVSDYDDYSNFFEVTNFSFSLKVEPQEEGVSAMSKSGQHGHAHATAAAGVGAGQKGGSDDAFDRWRSAKESELKNITYPVLFDTFSFDRIIDAASPVFFNNCANQISFKSATLVKRVARGDGQSVGFLRIELSDVMIKSLSWSDGDMVTETCEATCGHMTLKYIQQKYAGDLTGAAAQAEWDRLTNGQPNSKPGV